MSSSEVLRLPLGYILSLVFHWPCLSDQRAYDKIEPVIDWSTVSIRLWSLGSANAPLGPPSEGAPGGRLHYQETTTELIRLTSQSPVRFCHRLSGLINKANGKPATRCTLTGIRIYSMPFQIPG